MEIKQKDINRENLLNHGLVLLMQQGYHGTGLQEILGAVQIPKGSFIIILAVKKILPPKLLGITLNRI